MEYSFEKVKKLKDISKISVSNVSGNNSELPTIKINNINISNLANLKSNKMINNINLDGSNKLARYHVEFEDNNKYYYNYIKQATDIKSNKIDKLRNQIKLSKISTEISNTNSYGHFDSPNKIFSVKHGVNRIIKQSTINLNKRSQLSTNQNSETVFKLDKEKVSNSNLKPISLVKAKKEDVLNWENSDNNIKLNLNNNLYLNKFELEKRKFNLDNNKNITEKFSIQKVNECLDTIYSSNNNNNEINKDINENKLNCKLDIIDQIKSIVKPNYELLDKQVKSSNENIKKFNLDLGILKNISKELSLEKKYDQYLNKNYNIKSKDNPIEINTTSTDSFKKMRNFISISSKSKEIATINSIINVEPLKTSPNKTNLQDKLRESIASISLKTNKKNFLTLKEEIKSINNMKKSLLSVEKYNKLVQYTDPKILFANQKHTREIKARLHRLIYNSNNSCLTAEKLNTDINDKMLNSITNPKNIKQQIGKLLRMNFGNIDLGIYGNPMSPEVIPLRSDKLRKNLSNLNENDILDYLKANLKPCEISTLFNIFKPKSMMSSSKLHSEEEINDIKILKQKLNELFSKKDLAIVFSESDKIINKNTNSPVSKLFNKKSLLDLINQEELKEKKLLIKELKLRKKSEKNSLIKRGSFALYDDDLNDDTGGFKKRNSISNNKNQNLKINIPAINALSNLKEKMKEQYPSLTSRNADTNREGSNNNENKLFNKTLNMKLRLIKEKIKESLAIKHKLRKVKKTVVQSKIKCYTPNEFQIYNNLLFLNKNKKAKKQKLRKKLNLSNGEKDCKKRLSIFANSERISIGLLDLVNSCAYRNMIYKDKVKVYTQRKRSKILKTIRLNNTLVEVKKNYADLNKLIVPEKDYSCIVTPIS